LETGEVWGFAEMSLAVKVKVATATLRIHHEVFWIKRCHFFQPLGMVNIPPIKMVTLGMVYDAV
jgi:hypothetical protein